jgi:transcriptional regulator with XRE-family HTH domain
MRNLQEKCENLCFAQRFSSLRSGKTQSEFAELLGISRPTVGFYESGERIPDAITLGRIARICNVSADWLIGLSDVKSVERNIQVAAATLGISGKAAENLARISTEAEDDNLFISLKKSAARDALNRILESEDVLWVAEATDHLLDIEKARPRNIL